MADHVPALAFIAGRRRRCCLGPESIVISTARQLKEIANSRQMNRVKGPGPGLINEKVAIDRFFVH